MTLHDHLTAITAAAEAIPQSREDAAKHSPEWRHLLQCIRNLETPTAKASQLGGFSAVFKAALEVCNTSKQGNVGSEAKAVLIMHILDAAVSLGMLRADAA